MSICTTDDSGRDRNAPCQFPFKFRRILHNGCITQGSKNGKSWCATAVDKKRNQIKGKWGNCDQTLCQSLDFQVTGQCSWLIFLYNIQVSPFIEI